ncbi:MAG: restriction endonuclease subunit S [Oscillospiraceae bacterium]
MREMKDSRIEWVGAIPQNWQLSKIGSLYTQRNEKVSDKDYQPLSVTMQGILPQLATAAKTDDGDNRKLVRVGDFAINSRSDRRGSCGISPLDGSVSLINIILTPRTAMHPGYYNWLFHTTLFADEFYKWGHGIVADLWTTRWQEMKSITVPVPEYAEQERIAAFLNAECAEIDAVLEKTRASIEEYKKLKQAVITQAVTKGIRGDRPMKDSGIEWIGDIPESWEVSSVRYIGQLQNGISKGGEFFGKGFPFVSYGDVYKNYELPHSVSGLIDTTEDERATYSVEYGDIFFTRTSETIEEVGFSCVCKRSIPNATFAGFIIRLRPFCADEKILTDYAKYYFRGEHIRAYLVKEMNLVTRASLGQTLLKGMSVIVPPKSVQKEIAEYLDDKCADIDALVAKKQQYLTEIENYKKSLIYEYVTGKKEVV